VASVEGVLYGPQGIMELTYFWSLGVATNNQANPYALLQGLRQAKSNNVQQIIILGDSKNTIKHMRNGSLPKDSRLKAIILQKIRLEIQHGPQVEFLHFHQHNNSIADQKDNKAM